MQRVFLILYKGIIKCAHNRTAQIHPSNARESLTSQQTWQKAVAQADRRMLITAVSETTSRNQLSESMKKININYHIRLAVHHRAVTVHYTEFLTAYSINKLHSGPLVVFKFMLSVAIYCCPLG